MPYSVHGWVETGMDVGRGSISWRATLSLEVFGLIGDTVSDLLFGLAKQPSLAGFFKGRGIPADASALVSNAYAENRATIEQYADGEFGHTFALVSKIRALEQPIWDQVASSEDTGWRNVFAAIDAFPSWQESELVRLVVWAYW